MSVRNRYRRFEAYLERHRLLYYGLLFLAPVVARVCYAALGAEPIGEGFRQGVVFATAFVVTTAVLKGIFGRERVA
ncbi:hypothetical protein [Haloterrigena salinisoli]|uniref:hypothetical protein n=1 Tax=Haloterrigena salinisoli TaxID=3132747 RepID=UPI0030CD16DD